MKLETGKQIMFLMSLGHSTADIAAKLSLNIRTVEKYKEILMAAHGAKNSPHLMAIAFRNGIIQ